MLRRKRIKLHPPGSLPIVACMGAHFHSNSSPQSLALIRQLPPDAIISLVHSLRLLTVTLAWRYRFERFQQNNSAQKRSASGIEEDAGSWPGGGDPCRGWRERAGTPDRHLSALR